MVCLWNICVNTLHKGDNNNNNNNNNWKRNLKQNYLRVTVEEQVIFAMSFYHLKRWGLQVRFQLPLIIGAERELLIPVERIEHHVTLSLSQPTIKKKKMK
jgi:hypothetical protein